MCRTGCVYIPRYLTPARQLDLLESALTIYTLPPNPLSISTHYALPPNLFELYASSPRHSIQPLHSMRSKLEPRQERLRSREMRHTVETEPTAVVEYQEIISRIRSRSRLEVEPSERLGPKTVEQLMREIRWANLGWVYQVRSHLTAYYDGILRSEVDALCCSGQQNLMT